MKKIFSCQKCDAQYPKWVGRCSECGSWGSVSESLEKKSDNSEAKPSAKTVLLKDITGSTESRILTGISEFDRVLGGGIVPSSLVLIGGEPGIGKSTLLLQIAQSVNGKVLYTSGEESGSQIKMRLDRLGLSGNEIEFLSETDVDTVCSTIRKIQPKIAIIDSIQTLISDQAAGEAGNISQIRACTAQLLETAKSGSTAIFIVGHITKDGIVAGPKTLEHLVDTVLYIEGDRYHLFRLLRTVKNRFGSTNEVGVFEMHNEGLLEVKNPAKIFLEETKKNTAGVIITPTLEGTRIFLAELQALVTKTAFGYPQRKSVGFDTNRLSLLTAVLQKKAGIPLHQYDIHINVAGGLKIVEPATDLALAMAILSAYKNTPFPNSTTAIGEIGLAGEIRSVFGMDKRIKEAEKFGFTKIFVPPGTKIKNTSAELLEVSYIKEVFDTLTTTQSA